MKKPFATIQAVIEINATNPQENSDSSPKKSSIRDQMAVKFFLIY